MRVSHDSDTKKLNNIFHMCVHLFILRGWETGIPRKKTPSTGKLTVHSSARMRYRAPFSCGRQQVVFYDKCASMHVDDLPLWSERE